MLSKRIIHLLSDNKLSGAERVALDICSYLKGDFIFSYCSPKGEIQAEVEKNDIEFLPLNVMSVSEIRKAIKKWKPDLIHAHDYRASILAVLANPLTPIVSHLHQNNSEAKKISVRSLSYALFSPFFKRIVVTSQPVIDEFAFKRLINSKVSVVPNIINVHRILEKANKIKAKEIDLAFVGRLRPEKNPLLFIELVAQLKASYKNIKTVLIGDGELRNECEKKIKALGLKENIEMLGFLSNPYPSIKASKALIMTSLWEGFGLVALEAMLLGVPVVASNVGGLKDLVRVNETGYLCDSQEEFLHSIKSLLENSEMKCRLSINGEKFAKQYCDTENFANKFRKIYKSMT